jgi:hypothetical protein
MSSLVVFRSFALAALLTLTAAQAAPAEPVAIQLGRAKVAATRPAAGFAYELKLDATLGRESYDLRWTSPARTTATVVAGDAIGAMYGLQTLAAQLHAGNPATRVDETGRPAHAFRAIKFNLPWDAYRSNEAITQHLATCRDPAFWRAFLDMMAENRFNALTLWNLHPWPYLVRPKNFPEACPFDDAELTRWQELHRTIFRLAKERGIETYLVNWNIFVSPEFAAHHALPGRANITTARGATTAQEELVKRYNREAVTQVLNEFPDLTGIGLSLGEAMGGVTAEYRQQWMLDVIVAGVQQADRPARLIHRVPFSAGLSNGGATSRVTEDLTRNALESITNVELPIIIEAKFNWSHAHSSPKLIKVHGGPLTDAYANPAPKNFRMAWMLRNEDFFTLRWGEPDFIRELIARNSDPASVTGYFVGSECYIPALDYFTKAPPADRGWTYAFERQWLFYTLWGRLLYDPATPERVFEDAYAARYGEALAARLFRAQRLASRVPLRLTSFIDINNDKSFYAEGFLAREGVDSSQFLDLDLLIRKPVLDPTYLSITDYVKLKTSGQLVPADKLTPLALAQLVQDECNAVLREVATFPAADTEALRQEFTDLRAWAHLGLYFAGKLRAGVDLQFARVTGDATRRESARAHLTAAVAEWRTLAALTDVVYRTVPLTHLHYYEPGSPEWSRLKPELTARHRRDFADNYFSWSRLLPFVEADLAAIDRTNFQTSPDTLGSNHP